MGCAIFCTPLGFYKEPTDEKMEHVNKVVKEIANDSIYLLKNLAIFDEMIK